MVRYNKKKGGRKTYRKKRGRFSERKLDAKIKKVVDRKLDDAVEDKYVMDTVFQNQIAHYDLATRTFLIDATLALASGVNIDQRLGQKIKLKYLRTFFRLLPSKRETQIEHLPMQAWTENPLRDIPMFHCYFVRVNKDLVTKLTSSELRAVLNSKFRTPGQCWQDVAQAAGKSGIVGIKLLAKFKMKPKYRTVTSSVNSEITQAVPDAGAPPTYGMVSNVSETIVMQIPQYTYKNLLCSKVAQKIELENASGLPLKYNYIYFIQTTNAYNDNVYNPVIVPDSFMTRNVWVYEDA